MRVNRYALGFMAVTMLLTACAGRETVSPPSTLPLTAPVATVGDPTDLIGSWAVSGPGVEPDTVLRLADRDLTVFRGCAVLFGEWAADLSGVFVAAASGGSALDDRRTCSAANRPEPPGWLARARAFRTEDAVRVLLDDAGVQVAQLQPGARRSGGPDLDSAQVAPPTVTDEARRRLVPAKALPESLAPAATETLAGRWVPLTKSSRWWKPAHVTLAADGTWRGFDGCNGTDGRWVAGPDGVLLATGGVSTLIGCDNAPVGAWLTTARRAGFDGEVLVLLDAAGTETGRLRREG